MRLVAHNLRRIREMRGWTITRLADEMESRGYVTTVSYLSGIENCRSFPSDERLEQIAEALGVSVLALFADEESDGNLGTMLRELDDTDRASIQNYTWYLYVRRLSANMNPRQGDEFWSPRQIAAG